MENAFYYYSTYNAEKDTSVASDNKKKTMILSGRGMEVIYDEATLKEYVEKAVGVTPDRPLLIDLGSGTAKQGKNSPVDCF